MASNGVRRGPAPYSAPKLRDPLRHGRSTQQGSVPLALASLVLGSLRPLLASFEVSCCRFQIFNPATRGLFSRDAKPRSERKFASAG
jgi:hypothetical protein